MVPPPQSQQAPQSYYPYPQQAPHARTDVTAFITRRYVFLVITLGGLLVWINLVASAFGVTDPGTLRFLSAVGTTGGFIGFASSAIGALGSKQTDGNQNLGLLILSGAFVLATF